jgi:glutathione S-transferase
VLDLHNPLFATYVVAATLVILKASFNSWLVVGKMIKHNGGFRSPEDLKKTPINKNPHPNQLDQIEDVERARRVQLNDLENLPFFLVAGFLFVLTGPSLLLARILLFGYVALRFLHSYVYLSAFTHDARAKCFTPASLLLIFMTGWTLIHAVGYAL